VPELFHDLMIYTVKVGVPFWGRYAGTNGLNSRPGPRPLNTLSAICSDLIVWAIKRWIRNCFCIATDLVVIVLLVLVGATSLVKKTSKAPSFQIGSG